MSMYGTFLHRIDTTQRALYQSGGLGGERLLPLTLM